jgi:hypothetical protein
VQNGLPTFKCKFVPIEQYLLMKKQKNTIFRYLKYCL